MAWIQIPGGPIVNSNNVAGFSVQGAGLAVTYPSGLTEIYPMGSAANAGAQLAIIQGVIGVSIPGAATGISIQPTSISVTQYGQITITGTNLLASGTLMVGAFTVSSAWYFYFSPQQIGFYFLGDGSQGPPGVYDISYSDPSGGAWTLVGALTITP